MRSEQEIRARIDRLAKQRGGAEWAGHDTEAADCFLAETMLRWAISTEDAAR